MSGGDKGKKKKTDDKAAENAVPSYLGGGANSQFAQALPGQLSALAQQLSMGYGAPVAENMSMLESLYSPMNVPVAPVQNTPQSGSPQPSNQIPGQVGRGPAIVNPTGGGGSSLIDNWRQRQQSRQR